MYALRLVPALHKPFSIKLRPPLVSSKLFQRNVIVKKVTSFDIKSHAKTDVVLFQLEKPIFFTVLNLFSVAQCCTWTYLSVFLFQSLKTAELEFKSAKFWGGILESEKRYSNTLTAVSIFFGWAILAATVLYSSRSVRKIILHAGGNHATVMTYGLPGYNSYKVPLKNVCAFDHRAKAKKYIPIKLKNKFFYYLIDVQGDFSNPSLFDFTIGVKRGF